jgi:3-hydroxyacyl-[acyl-carrier-protein] dehydratase
MSDTPEHDSQQLTRTHLTIAADHPAFAGHFPGTPIVPGVLLLDEALYAISTAMSTVPESWSINSVKFLSPLKPGEAVIIEHEMLASGAIRFEVNCGTRKIVSGSVSRYTAAGS